MEGSGWRDIRAAPYSPDVTGAERKRRWREQNQEREYAAARARYAQRKREEQRAERERYWQRRADRAAGGLPDPWASPADAS